MRVVDTTAHQAVSALSMQLALSLKKSEQEKFDQAFRKLFKKQQGGFSYTDCDKQQPKPSYYPRYMIQHGIKAVNGGVTGLVKNFNEDEAWQEVYSKYLKCPKN